jgi:NADH:ubiquinone oxidoreductase subunit 5 (subunit L)/multisubunit Na+/H+ antiporter MnhA subunit
LHSSTLVIAPLILLLCYEMNYSVFNNNIIIFISICNCTLLIIVFLGSNVSQLKRFIASSTITHMTFILIEISMNLYYIAIAHILIHSFIKSLLFIFMTNLIVSVNFYDIRVNKVLNKFHKSTSYSIIIFLLLINLGGIFSLLELIEIIITSNINLIPLYQISLIVLCIYAIQLSQSIKA